MNYRIASWSFHHKPFAFNFWSCAIVAATLIIVVGPCEAEETISLSVALQTPAGETTDVFKLLEEESNWNLAGHPVSYGTLLVGMSSDRRWNIPATIDEPTFAKQGIRLDDMVVPHPLIAGGVTRRSSLRFVLNAAGLGCYVRDNSLIVTTERVARVQWVSQLPKPEPQMLTSDSLADRRQAVFAAGFWQIDPDAWIAPLEKALKDVDRQVRFDAAFALGALGPQAANAIDSLISLLKQDDLTVREAAVFALGRIGPKAVKKLLALIDDRDPDIAIAAAKSIGVMGSVAHDAVPGLIAAGMRHARSVELYRRIAMSIAAIDLGDALPKLRELLKSNAAGVRAFSAFTIAQMGPLGRPCATELLPLLADGNNDVRWSAAYALATADLPEDFPTAALESAVNDTERNVSLWAQKALRVINSKKQQNLP